LEDESSQTGEKRNQNPNISPAITPLPKGQKRLTFIISVGIQVIEESGLFI